MVLDQLLQRFIRSQPWQILLEPSTAEQARQAIRDAFNSNEENARNRFLHKLEDFLQGLESDPLSVLGHPPLGTKDPDVFRYTIDPQANISVVADLDEQARTLRVTWIKIKTGGSHGRHR